MPKTPSEQPRDLPEQTRVQADPPPTMDSSVETTQPSLSIPANGPPDYPFLTPPQSPEEIGRLGDYRILKLLGEGGMGFVFRGEDPTLKRFVALKVMRPEIAKKPQAADRFLREGRAAAGLKSDHIITIYEADTANGVPYLAMEYLEGLPLDVWFKQQKKAIPLPHVLRVVKDMLRGLAAAHDKGLIHRDIKPANLWIEKGTSRIKLLDFGLTRSQDSSDQMTADGAVVGTPAFMAPEQASGKPVDPRADLFSVGTVMYTLFARKNPFSRDGILGTLSAVGFEVQPPVTTVRPDVPAEYSAFLDRLLAKDPAGRPANAKAAFQELVAIEKKLADATKTNTTIGTPFIAVPLQEAAPQVWGALTEDEGVRVRTGAATETTRSFQPEDADTPRKPPNKKLLLGSLFAFFALVLGGITIIITNKDGTKTKIEVDVPEGAKVEVKDGGKTVAKVEPKKSTPTKVTMDADRRAAEFVLANGGLVTIGERGYGANDVASLPAEPFKCLHIDLPARELTDAEADLVMAPDSLTWISINYPLTEANLVRLTKQPAAKTLRTLGANAVALTDDGLKRFRDFAQLNALALLNFTGTGTGLKDWEGWGLTQLGLGQLTDAFQDDNLQYLGKLPNLISLDLVGTGLTDRGVKHVAEISTLDGLTLVSERLSDAAIEPLQKHVKLHSLRIGNDIKRKGGLTGKSLNTVSRIPNLARIDMLNVPVQDADVKPLLGTGKLRFINLDQPGEFGDAGLLSLAAVKTLTEVGVTGGRVTADGVKKFKAARPDVKLQGQLAALADPDRAAAEFVIGRGGQIGVINEEETFPHLRKTIPEKPFKLVRILLAQATDSDLNQFRELAHLRDVFLNSETLNDTSVAKLATLPCVNVITHLTIYSPKFTDEMLRTIPQFKNLEGLSIGEGFNLTGAGLAHLKESRVNHLHFYGLKIPKTGMGELKQLLNLKVVSFTFGNVPDEAIQQVADIRELNQLELTECEITDGGLRHLESHANLSIVSVTGTPHTDAGLRSLAKLPKLEKLSLFTLPKVTDEGIQAIAKSVTLQEARITAIPITDASLVALAECKSLRVLTLKATKVTVAGVAAFRKARPDVQVTSDIDEKK